MGLDIFKDDKFEEMDDIVQMLEPYEFLFNERLAAIPETTEITANQLLSVCKRNYNRITLRGLIDDLNLKENSFVNPYLQKIFKIEMQENTVFDLKTLQLNNSILLIKNKNCLDDKDILSMYESRISSINVVGSRTSKSNLKEVCELFGVALTSDKYTNQQRLKIKLIELIKSNELNIRNVDLFFRFATYIENFISNGNLAALSNIAKIKIMSRKGDPIYSIKEEAV